MSFRLWEAGGRCEGIRTMHLRCSMPERTCLKLWLCLSLWLIQDSNWKGRVLWKLSGGLATILQNRISCNEQKMREPHITRRGMSFYLLIFIEKIINRKIEHSQIKREGSRNSLPIEANRNRRQPTSIRKRTSGSQHRGRCFRGSCQRPYPKHFRRGQG